MASKKTYHDLEVKQVFKTLGTQIRGLKTGEAKSRLVKYGPNELVEKDRTTNLNLVLDQLRNPLVAVLVAAAVLSWILGKTINSFIPEYRDLRPVSSIQDQASLRLILK